METLRQLFSIAVDTALFCLLTLVTVAFYVVAIVTAMRWAGRLRRVRPTTGSPWSAEPRDDPLWDRELDGLVR